MKKRMRFKDQIRRIMMFSALGPLAAATMLLIVLLAVVWMSSVVTASRKTLDTLSTSLEAQHASYVDRLSEMRGLEAPQLLSSSGDYASFKAEIYRYMNEQSVSGAFYLLDEDGALLFSTERDQLTRERTHAQLYWRLLRAMRADAGEPTTVMTREATLYQSNAALLTGVALKNGFACFALPAASFSELVTGQRAETVITDRFGSLYLSSTSDFHEQLGKVDISLEEFSGFVARGAERYYVSNRSVLGGALHVYAISDATEIIRTITILALVMTAVFTALLVVIIRISRRIADEKTQIIDDVVLAFKEARDGNLNTHLEINSGDEFEIIGDSYNTMLGSIRSLMDRSVELAAETAVSRIRQLEAQFNPHFLFNTLESIRFMIRMDTKKADAMILCLSRLLRYSIKSETEDVSLSEELSYVYSYLNLLKYRFGDKLQYDVDVPEALDAVRVPRLIAQPILENAVIYGFAGKENLHVQMSASAQEGMLVLVVEDDGPGFEPDVLAELERKMDEEHVNTGRHIGILNIHYRLRLLYGREYGLNIESRSGEGTRVYLRLPLRTQEGEMQ